MKVISRSKLRAFWERPGCMDAKQPLLAWFREAEQSRWRTPAEVKDLYRTADVVGAGRIVFNIGGNKYRLVAWVKFDLQLILIKWVGTHAEYDRVDVRTIGLPDRKGSTR